MKEMAKIICGYRAVGGNYNSPRDSLILKKGIPAQGKKKRKTLKLKQRMSGKKQRNRAL
jgi:hypothetical protein